MKKGFTLVELLIIIAIIALLLSIILPCLKRAKESAYSTKCCSNLHQFTLGCHAYVQDYKVLPYDTVKPAFEVMDLPKEVWICPANKIYSISYFYPATAITYRGNNFDTRQSWKFITRSFEQSNSTVSFVEDYVNDYHGYRNCCSYDGAIRKDYIVNRVVVIGTP